MAYAQHRKQPTFVTASTADLWTPLLNHLQKKHPEFGTLLCEVLISSLTTQVTEIIYPQAIEDTEESQQDLLSPGYYLCLSGWLLWVESNWNEVPGCDAESITVELLRNMPREAVP